MSLLGFSSSNTNCLETSTALLFRGFYTAYYINSDMILCQPLASISWDFKELCFLIVCSVSQILQRGGHYLITWFSNRPLSPSVASQISFLLNISQACQLHLHIKHLHIKWDSDHIWAHWNAIIAISVFRLFSVSTVGATAIQVINEHVLYQGSSKMHHLA